MSRTRVRCGRGGLLVAVLVAVVATAGRAAEQPAEPASSRRYLVRPGDTLWDIARSQVGPEGDPRAIVEDIRSTNGLDTATLTPGVRLILP